MEYKAYVDSHVAHDILKLDWEVPKTNMSVETTASATSVSLVWMNGLSSILPLSPFLKTCLCSGNTLVQQFDIGPVMTAKILTPTDEIVHHRVYRPLTPEGLADPVKQDNMKAFLQMAEDQ